jgi:predicted phosphodiesterase
VAANLLHHRGTTVEVPPLGRLSARTHSTAVGVDVRLLELDVEEVQRELGSFDGTRSVRSEIDAELPDLLRRTAQGTVLKAALLGAIVGLMVPSRRWWHAVVGALGSSVAVAVAMAGVARSYDVQAFAAPEFEGALSRAPTVIEAVQGHVAGLDEVQDRIETLSAQLEDLFAAASGDLAIDDGADTTILHVSDIHSNPVGVEIAGQLATSFDVDAILDTGDLTSFGLPVEARIGELIAGIGRPWHLVAGNHDSALVRASLASSAPNLEILDETVANVGGVRILGMSDPTFTASNELSTAAAAEVKQEAAADVAELLERETPDVLAVHDPAQASEAAGLVPVVVAGHVHRTTSELRDGTRFLTVGSTGATGLGAFTVEADLSYEAALLRFDGGELVAVDHVTVHGLDGGFTLRREVIEPPVAD